MSAITLTKPTALLQTGQSSCVLHGAEARASVTRLPPERRRYREAAIRVGVQLFARADSPVPAVPRRRPGRSAPGLARYASEPRRGPPVPNPPPVPVPPTEVACAICQPPACAIYSSSGNIVRVKSSSAAFPHMFPHRRCEGQNRQCPNRDGRDVYPMPQAYGPHA